MALALGANGLMSWPGAAPNEAELELQTLLEQSVQLDNELVTVVSRPRVVNGLAAVAIVDLEDQIHMIDDRIGLIDVRVLRALSASEAAANQQRFDVRLLRSILEREIDEDELRQLLRERVVLLDVLVNTHNKRTVYVGH